jgi:integrase
MASPKPRYSRGEETLTPDELLAVLKAARRRSVRDWAMVLIAHRHGYRAAEICALRLDDIRDGAITTPRLKGSLKTVQPLYEHRGQPLLDESRALKKYLAERLKDGSRFVFVSRKGGKLDPSQFFRLFQTIAKIEASHECAGC